MTNIIPTEHFTDLTNAQRFVERHQHIVRYVPGWGWLIWNGTHWYRDTTYQIHALAKETILSLYPAAENLPKEQAILRQKMRVQARDSQKPQRIHALLELALSEPSITLAPSAFDADPYLLNVLNGTLDLRTGELLPHDPQRLITRLAPVSYQPEATSPIWQQFLSAITGHNQELQDYLQRAVGYSLTASTKEEVLFILYGQGRNGKSCFLAALSSILGDYARYTNSSVLMRRCPKNMLASALPVLTSARFATASETELDATFNLSLIKCLTSGEPIPLTTPRGEEIVLHPRCKIWLATNTLPTIVEFNTATWQRIKLIRFPSSFIAQRDTDLAAKLQSSASAILAWAVQGALLWHQHGLQEPPIVRQSTETYYLEQDPLAHFLNECCTNGPDKIVSARALYNAYHTWSLHNHDTPLGENTFFSYLLTHGYQRIRRTSGKYYCGLTLNENTTRLSDIK